MLWAKRIGLATTMTTYKTFIFSALTCLASLTAQAQTDESYFDYLYDEETGTGSIYLNGKVEAASLTGEITIPSTYNDDPITTIKEGGFMLCTGITKVIIEAGVQEIGENAFNGCTAIKEVTIPKSVTTLGSQCFANCPALETVYFEGGGKLTTIPSGAFTNCDNMAELTVPEGVTTIETNAFYGCTKLKSLTLPKTVETLGVNIYNNAIDTVRLYAAVPPTISNSFSSADAKVLLVPDPDVYTAAGWDTCFTNILPLFSFAEETTTDGKLQIAVTDQKTALEAIHAIADDTNTGKYYNASVVLKNDIAFTPVEFDADTTTATNVFTFLSALPTIATYAGELTGATISNLTMRSSGLFRKIDEGAKVNGLVFEDALLYVDPTDDRYETDGDDVTIHLLADTLYGAVTNFGFSGDILVDEDFASGKEISVSAVNEMGETGEISGFLHIGSLLTQGNTKRCITIKQNLGVKRPPGKSTKLATSKSLASNKSATDGFYTYSADELTKSIREFSDDEFAAGAVAYWLNYSGPGYTGDYTGYWAQGKKVPVPATTVGGVSNALFLVDYGTTDMTHVTAAKQFANNGSEITIEYDQTPASVTIGGQEFKDFGTSSMTVTFDHTKAISIAFNKSVTGLDEPKAAQISVITSGLTVSVSGQAAGSTIRLISLTGKTVAATNGQSLTAPAPGLYVLRVGGQTRKVVLK